MINTDSVRLQFGLNHALPEGLTTAWGARLIFPADLLWDRQSFPGVETTKGQKLKHWLNTCGALKKALAEARRAAKNYRLTPEQNKAVTLYEDETGIILGDPQASYGYLYVAAWLKEQVKANA